MESEALFREFSQNAYCHSSAYLCRGRRATGFIPKPFDESVLLEQIASCFSFTFWEATKEEAYLYNLEGLNKLPVDLSEELRRAISIGDIDLAVAAIA